MLFLFGERKRVKSAPIGNRECVLCHSEQLFTEQVESLWFTFFGLPILPMEQAAKYWRCENCLSSYQQGDLSAPSQVPVIKLLITYILLGYNRHQHQALASEICMKITGFELEDSEYKSLLRQLGSGDLDIVQHVRGFAGCVNGAGKQQIVEAAFLTTHTCCDMQYEDRLRVNLIGNALDVGLEFVEYCIQQVRRQNYYGVRRLLGAAEEV